MNGGVKCVDNQSKNSECMHVKCKYVVTVVWNNCIGIKFHFYHLATILWGMFFYFFIDNKKVFYKFCYYIIEDNVHTSGFVFQFRI